MKKRRSEGFLLIEAALTTAVLAVGVTAVFRAFSADLRTTRESRERLEALCLLESRVWELEKFPDGADAPPSEDPLLGPISWDVKVVSGEDGQRRDVTLAWGPAGRRSDLTLSSDAGDP